MQPGLRAFLVRGRSALRRVARTFRRESSESYWTRHNVTGHRAYPSAEASLAHLEWRNGHYIDYDRLMPLSGADDLSVLDFGCGPGHDLVGFATRSRPARLVGYDVSPTSVAEAGSRLGLHGANVELVCGRGGGSGLPFADESFDLVHSSGVIHHTANPGAELAELRRVVRPGGRAQIMVYNYDCLFLHLEVAFTQQISKGLYRGLPIREAFSRFTDGEGCPIAGVYRPEEFLALAAGAGWTGTFRGAAISVAELAALPRRWDAIAEARLGAEHRRFLAELEIDHRGVPRYRGVNAGVDGCYDLRPA